MLQFFRSTASRARRAAAVSLLAGTAFAGSAIGADVYVVHAVDGTDLGQAQAFAIDVGVDASCVLNDVQFGSVNGPLSVTEGERFVEVKVTDGTCTGAVVITARIQLAVDEKAVLVVHLDQNGTPKISKFSVNDGTLDPADVRVSVLHLAAAPAVDFDIRDEAKKKNKTKAEDVANGDQTYAVDLQAATFKIKVRTEDNSETLLNVTGLPLAGNVILVFAGSVANSTLTIIPVVIT
jgi:hypothetical protein